MRGSRDWDIFTAVRDCEISIAARRAVFFVLSFSLFPCRSPPTRETLEYAIWILPYNYSFFFPVVQNQNFLKREPRNRLFLYYEQKCRRCIVIKEMENE